MAIELQLWGDCEGRSSFYDPGIGYSTNYSEAYSGTERARHVTIPAVGHTCNLMFCMFLLCCSYLFVVIKVN
jgi:hypothetical protein